MTDLVEQKGITLDTKEHGLNILIHVVERKKKTPVIKLNRYSYNKVS